MTSMSMLLFIAMCLAFLFLGSELILLLTKHSGRKKTSKQSDKGSLIFLWIAIVAGLSAGFNMADYKEWHFTNTVIGATGLSLSITGLIIRWVAIFQLNRSFTVNISFTGDQNLKTDGLYGIVRHPSYLGLLMFMTGEALTMNSMVSFVAVLFPVCLAVLYRILVEEKLLMDCFGDAYKKYKQQTRCLVPFVF